MNKVAEISSKTHSFTIEMTLRPFMFKVALGTVLAVTL